jgi:hypothetical protein
VDADTKARLDEIHAMLKSLLRQTGPKRPMQDEKIFKDASPKYWTGEMMTGRQMSECPADYLYAFAKYKGACAFMARKENDPEKVKYADRDERSAKLAHEWATYREAVGEPATSGTVEDTRRAPADDFGF